MSTLSQQDYIKALKKLEKSPSDRVATLGTLGVVATGAGAGALGATGLASVFGISTLLGSSTLASLAGGVFVVSNPVGWAFGTAAAGAAAAYGISKLVSNGAKHEEKKQADIKAIKAKLDNYNKEIKKTSEPDKIGQVAGAFALLLENDLMEDQKVTAILTGVESGEINAEYALSIAQSIIDETSNAISNAVELDISNMTVRSAFIILFKHMIHSDGFVHDNEIKAYQDIMKVNFKCSNEYAHQLLDEAPKISNIEIALKDLSSIIPPDKNEILIESLIGIGFSDGNYNSDEKEFVAKVKRTLIK